MRHFDFNAAGAHSYEQSLLTLRQLGASMASIEEQFRRMLFNVVARNQDDHVKNISYLMNKKGEWTLAPAFDVTYSYNPGGDWTAKHQMTIQGKRDDFSRSDIEACGKVGLLKRGRVATLLDQVQESVKKWPEFAKQAQVGKKTIQAIGSQHRVF